MLQVNGHALILNNGDTLSNASSSGFTVTLGSSHQSFVNSLFYANGNTDASNYPYGLSTNTGWDGANSPALNAIPVIVSHANSLALTGLTTNSVTLDTQSTSVFATIVLTDANKLASAESATISFVAANGILSGQGLSMASTSDGVVSFHVTATSAANLQQALRSLVFTPTAHQLASIASVNTAHASIMRHYAAPAHQSVTTQFNVTITDNPSTYWGGLSNPVDLTTDSQNNVWVANQFGAVEILSANGSIVQLLDASNGIRKFSE